MRVYDQGFQASRMRKKRIRELGYRRLSVFICG
jgi:hypothetical protein